MPLERKVINKFKLIEYMHDMISAISEDVITEGKISFHRKEPGVFYTSFSYEKAKTPDETQQFLIKQMERDK